MGCDPRGSTAAETDAGCNNRVLGGPVCAPNATPSSVGGSGYVGMKYTQRRQTCSATYMHTPLHKAVMRTYFVLVQIVFIKKNVYAMRQRAIIMYFLHHEASFGSKTPCYLPSPPPPPLPTAKLPLTPKRPGSPLHHKPPMNTG